MGIGVSSAGNSPVDNNPGPAVPGYQGAKGRLCPVGPGGRQVRQDLGEPWVTLTVAKEEHPQMDKVQGHWQARPSFSLPSQGVGLGEGSDTHRFRAPGPLSKTPASGRWTSKWQYPKATCWGLQGLQTGLPQADPRPGQGAWEYEEVQSPVPYWLALPEVPLTPKGHPFSPLGPLLAWGLSLPTPAGSSLSIAMAECLTARTLLLQVCGGFWTMPRTCHA